MDLFNLARQPWVEEALCAQTDPDIFYPEKGEPSEDAKQICYQCPVIHDCLQWALDNREVHGIWGGTSMTDRRIMGYTHGKSGPGQPPPPDETWHGTKAGARRHYREGSPVCADCRATYNQFERVYRRYTRKNRSNTP